MTPKQELQKFLQENPSLTPFQRRIENKLSKVPEELRLVNLARLMVDNLNQLAVELELLNLKIKEVNVAEI